MAERPVYRPARQTGMDPTTRRLALIAGCMGAVLVALVGGYSLVRHDRAAGGIPVIAPPPGPMKVRPANPGGLQVLGAEPPPSTDANGAEVLAPGPEKADPQALAAELARARQAALPPPPPPRAATTALPPTAGTAPPPAPILPAPPSLSSASSSSASSPATASAAAPKPVSLAPPPVSPPVSTPPVGGRVTVQLGALDSEAHAHAEWQRLAARDPTLFGVRALVVMPVDHQGRTLWRIRTGGFASVADATSFCTHVHAIGGACNVATF